jgi:uncharacterized membrane protein
MSNPDTKAIAAALLGASAGMRTVTPVAVLVTRGRLRADPPVAKAIFIAGAAELIIDKLPGAPSRTKRLPYLARMASGAYSAWHAGGQNGALVGAAAAAAATTLGHQARKLPKTRASGLSAALIEDALALGAAHLAVTLVSAE